MTTGTSTERPAEMDPRVAARRSELAAQRMRTRRRVLAVIVSVIIIAGIAVGVFFTPVLDVDRVIVRGNEVVPAEAIRQASRVRVGDPTVLVRTGQVDRRIEKLPYIASARVKRVFPGTVIITVRERVGVAWTIRSDGSLAVLDATGRVLATVDGPPEGLPRIEGLDAVPDPGQRVRPTELPKVVAELPPGLRSITAVVGVDDTGITLRLLGDLTVRLGDAADIAAKGAVAEAVLARTKPGTRIVDVRVPTSPVSI